MRRNFFAIKNKTKADKKKANRIVTKLAKTNIPHVNGRALSLFLSLLLTSCRTSACIFLLHQGSPFPLCHVPVAGGSWQSFP